MKKIFLPFICILFFLTAGCGDTYEEKKTVRGTPAYRHSREHNEVVPVPIPIPVEEHHRYYHHDDHDRYDHYHHRHH